MSRGCATAASLIPAIRPIARTLRAVRVFRSPSRPHRDCFRNSKFRPGRRPGCAGEPVGLRQEVLGRLALGRAQRRERAGRSAGRRPRSHPTRLVQRDRGQPRRRDVSPARSGARLPGIRQAHRHDRRFVPDALPGGLAMKTGPTSFMVSETLRTSVLRAQSALLKAQTEMGSGRVADAGLALGAGTGQLVSFGQQAACFRPSSTRTASCHPGWRQARPPCRVHRKRPAAFKMRLSRRAPETRLPVSSRRRRGTPCGRSPARSERHFGANTSLEV